jgi:hypothetical protein
MPGSDSGWKWHENPTKEDVSAFVFLTVDVIDSSDLFYEDMPDEDLLEKAAAMNAVYEHVLHSLGLARGSAYEWNWAGDGGVFAFPADTPLTLANVLERSKAIANLEPFTLLDGSQLHLQLRIVIDRGFAYFHVDKGLRRSAALNAASKLRVPGKRTSLTITERVRKKLYGEDKKPALWKAIPVPHRPQKSAYGLILLMSSALAAEIKVEKTRDKAQAAHLFYRLGTLTLGAGDCDAAAAAFEEARDLVAQIGPHHRYYWRTLHEFYELWRILASGAKRDLLKEADGHDWLAMMRSGFHWETFTKDNGPEGRWRLLVQLELIMEQLDVLAGQPVNDPVGLTSLEVCLLLERVGYARRWYGAALSERIERIKDEMESEPDHTIDSGCTMCTGVAASCLILDGQREADALMRWLRLRERDGFRYRRHDSFADAEPQEHAVHYAAAVLQAFLDHGFVANDIYIDRALDVFFDRKDFQDGTFPADWRRWLNTNVYDFCSYIFPTFARYILAAADSSSDGPSQIQSEGVDILRRTLRSLALQVLKDGGDAILPLNKRGRVYGARESIGSFALGLLIGLPTEAVAILHYNMRRFAAYAERGRSEAHRRRTIDSSIDRSRKMLEGWLLQIECALWLRDNDKPLPDFVVECLGIDRQLEKQ